MIAKSAAQTCITGGKNKTDKKKQTWKSLRFNPLTTFDFSNCAMACDPGNV
jgi:hypothetical protein